MKTRIQSILGRWLLCSVVFGFGWSGLSALAQDIPARPDCPTNAPIPWDQIGVKAGADYKGDGLSVYAGGDFTAAGGITCLPHPTPVPVDHPYPGQYFLEVIPAVTNVIPNGKAYGWYKNHLYIDNPNVSNPYYVTVPFHGARTNDLVTVYWSDDCKSWSQLGTTMPDTNGNGYILIYPMRPAFWTWYHREDWNWVKQHPVCYFRASQPELVKPPRGNLRPLGWAPPPVDAQHRSTNPGYLECPLSPSNVA
jgi:hypothetical protein